MKAEHRHQLHTNALADRMGRLVKGMRSTPRSTSVFVWTFVLLALVTFAAWQIYARTTQNSRSSLWVTVDESTHKAEAGLAELDRLGREDWASIPGRTARF